GTAPACAMEGKSARPRKDASPAPLARLPARLPSPNAFDWPERPPCETSCAAPSCEDLARLYSFKYACCAFRFWLFVRFVSVEFSVLIAPDGFPRNDAR